MSPAFSEPSDIWLRSARPYADRSAKIDVAHGRTRVRLYEATAEVGAGTGGTIAEAFANALNSIMARQEEAAAASDECDRIHAERTRKATTIGLAPVRPGDAPRPAPTRTPYPSTYRHFEKTAR